MTYREFCEKLAKEAGKVIAKNFSTGMKKQWKGNDTPVTKTDIAVNKLVISFVKKYFPGHDVLGEEESFLKNKSEYVWVCDPVDGTVPFSHGIPTCVFSLALVKNGKPIVGIIYDVFIDRMYYAEKGKGAFCNRKKIWVNNRGLDNSVLNWESPGTMGYLKKKYPKSLPISLCCVIYGGMLVANGELVASFYPWSYAHDGASLKIIVEEAGGIVTDIDGQDQRYDGKINGFLASNKVVHKQLLDIVRIHRKNIP